MKKILFLVDQGTQYRLEKNLLIDIDSLVDPNSYCDDNDDCYVIAKEYWQPSLEEVEEMERVLREYKKHL